MLLYKEFFKWLKWILTNKEKYKGGNLMDKWENLIIEILLTIDGDLDAFSNLIDIYEDEKF
ncbi:hypothetical protein M2E15_2830 [Bacillus mycoides]|uniref:hypothetical protein n=1 Tax=Bacillus mycoides TaxID=1405 RepID=UPI0002FD7AEE|nr:hypothetical protein [Bacillus mycoides]KUH42734.1 hypothetical protein M2E15_2830 [Bacillus mycoides]